MIRDVTADFKNRRACGTLDGNEESAILQATEGRHPRRHLAYAWDHMLMADLPLSWALLEWSGDDSGDGPSTDTAYFTHTPEAEMDAKVFALLREGRFRDERWV